MLIYGKNGYANVHQYCVKRTLPVLYISNPVGLHKDSGKITNFMLKLLDRVNSLYANNINEHF
jgi:hypothetical protein